MNLVIRFSSLGDVVLAGALTKALGDCVFVTAEAWAPVARRLEGVVDVVALRPGESAVSLRSRLPKADRTFDLHASLRSLAVAPGATRWEPLRALRRARVALKWPERLPPVVERYAAVAGLAPAPPPWIRVAPQGEAALGLCPGAAWPTKRWGGFAELARLWEGPVSVFAGPRDVIPSLRGEIFVEEGFERTLPALAACRVAVSGDSGLLHLAAALGVPVVGIFGPTTSADGFWSHAGEVVERELPCRPCSRFGGTNCPIGDHACMEIPAEQALAAALRIAR